MQKAKEKVEASIHEAFRSCQRGKEARGNNQWRGDARKEGRIAKKRSELAKKLNEQYATFLRAVQRNQWDMALVRTRLALHTDLDPAIVQICEEIQACLDQAEGICIETEVEWQKIIKRCQEDEARAWDRTKKQWLAHRYPVGHEFCDSDASDRSAESDHLQDDRDLEYFMAYESKELSNLRKEHGIIHDQFRKKQEKERKDPGPLSSLKAYLRNVDQEDSKKHKKLDKLYWKQQKKQRELEMLLKQEEQKFQEKLGGRKATRLEETALASGIPIDDPEDAEGWNRRGNLLYKQGKLDQANAAYDQAIAREQLHLAAHYGKARIFEKRQDYENAAIYYQLAFEIEPEFQFASWKSTQMHKKAAGSFELDPHEMSANEEELFVHEAIVQQQEAPDFEKRLCEVKVIGKQTHLGYPVCFVQDRRTNELLQFPITGGHHSSDLYIYISPDGRAHFTSDPAHFSRKDWLLTGYTQAIPATARLILIKAQSSGSGLLALLPSQLSQTQDSSDDDPLPLIGFSSSSSLFRKTLSKKSIFLTEQFFPGDLTPPLQKFGDDDVSPFSLQSSQDQHDAQKEQKNKKKAPTSRQKSSEIIHPIATPTTPFDGSSSQKKQDLTSAPKTIDDDQLETENLTREDWAKDYYDDLYADPPKQMVSIGESTTSTQQEIDELTANIGVGDYINEGDISETEETEETGSRAKNKKKGKTVVL